LLCGKAYLALQVEEEESRCHVVRGWEERRMEKGEARAARGKISR